MFLLGRPMLLTPLVCFLFTFESSQELLVHPWRPPAAFACFPACWDGPLEVTLENQPVFLESSLFSTTVLHWILPSRPLDWLKSALMKTRDVILLFALFPPLRILKSTISCSLQPRLLPTFASLISSSCCKNQTYQSAVSLFTLAVVITALPKPPVLPGQHSSLVAPADTGTV